MCFLCEKEVAETEVRIDFHVCEAEVLRGHKGEVHFLEPKNFTFIWKQYFSPLPSSLLFPFYLITV